MLKQLCLLLTIALSPLCLAENCQAPEGLLQAKPDLRFEVKQAAQYPANSCAVITFKLKEKPRSGGRTMKAYGTKIHATNNPEFAKQAKRTVKKWVFLSKRVDKKARYYALIHN